MTIGQAIIVVLLAYVLGIETQKFVDSITNRK